MALAHGPLTAIIYLHRLLRRQCPMLDAFGLGAIPALIDVPLGVGWTSMVAGWH